jgi:hypothetical protein
VGPQPRYWEGKPMRAIMLGPEKNIPAAGWAQTVSQFGHLGETIFLHTFHHFFKNICRNHKISKVHYIVSNGGGWRPSSAAGHLGGGWLAPTTIGNDNLGGSNYHLKRQLPFQTRSKAFLVFFIFNASDVFSIKNRLNSNEKDNMNTNR